MGRIGRFRVWADSLVDNNAASTAPTDAANGVAIPGGRKNETLHLLAAKANVADFAIWGYCANTAKWFQADAVSFTGTGNESELLTGLTAFTRIHAQRTDANVANTGCNTYWGFSE